MEAAIVTIGDEILIGQITDTNSVWISRQLTSMGVHVYELVSISDTGEHITGTIDRLTGKVDLILMTGGLGPTKDDVTKDVLARFFGTKLVLNREVLATIEVFFRKRGRLMIDSNRRQAMLPENCRILKNNHGTAPGMWFTKENTNIVSMPGIPYEMKPMLLEQLLPAMTGLMGMPALVHKTIMTHGVPESYLAEMIGDWESGLPDCMKLAYLPRPGIVRLRLTAMGLCTEKADQLLKEKIDALQEIISEHIYGFDDVLLEEAVGTLLRSKDLTLSTAESCTGGNIARLITSVPGSSAYFKGSLIAYSNLIKSQELNVDKKLIEKHGAVSREVVEAMVKGAIEKFNTETAVATSGIAGPDGGTTEKPVGMVWISVAWRDQMYSKKFRFGGHRELIIEQASMMGIGLLRKLIAKKLT